MQQLVLEEPLPAAFESDAATAHDAQGQPIKGKYHTYPEMAAAGLWTTPSELAKVVMELQTGGHVLRPATQREMLTKIFRGLRTGPESGRNRGAEILLPRRLQCGVSMHDVWLFKRRRRSRRDDQR